MSTFNVVILDAYKPSRFRISKDTCGGYGTENDFGYGFIPNMLSFVAKYSLFWSPLAVLNLISEFKNNNLFRTSYTSNPEIIGESTDYLFISSSIVCCNYELEVVKKIKQNFPKIKIFAFGSFVDYYKDRYLELGTAVILGEPEFLFQNFKIDSKNLNLLFANKIINITKRDPNNLAPPLWSTEKTVHSKNFLFGYKNGYAPIIATRGCPYSCYEYCVYPLQQGRKINAADPEKIISDIEFINKNTKIKNFVYRDPVFSINRKYTDQLVSAMNKLENKYEFTIETHLNNIDSQLAEDFSNANIKWVKFGIESAIDDVKSNVNRYSLNNDDQFKRVEYCRNNKIKTVAMYILCQPDDNFDTHYKTIEYAKSLRTNLAQFSIFTPYPGTPFYQKNKELINDFDFENFNQYNLVFKHNIFNKDSAKSELGKAYSKYYLNKLKVW